jgi:cleavage and polyadenylation specificity factor subunit 3
VFAFDFRFACGLISDTVSVTHSHHHHHHPHAEREEEGTGTVTKLESDVTPAPSRIDRLIAFLDSHFGNVELMTAEEARASVDELAGKMEGEAKLTSTADEGEGGEGQGGERDGSQLPGEKVSTAPVIRVRVDQHAADVSLESLVSCLWEGRAVSWFC